MKPFQQLPKRLFAWGMARANRIDQASIPLTHGQHHHNLADLKRSLLGTLKGTILEIGPGAGASFSYLPNTVNWIGVEPNSFMHPYLRQEAIQKGFHAIELHGGTAENLPLAEAIVDTVVSFHVLCSVQNLDQVLQEVQRVLKPGGQFIFLEHVAADRSTWTQLAQNSITPLWKILFDNCHPNRETWKALETAGFATLNYQNLQINLPIVSPHIVGIATRPN